MSTVKLLVPRGAGGFLIAFVPHSFIVLVVLLNRLQRRRVTGKGRDNARN